MVGTFQRRPSSLFPLPFHSLPLKTQTTQQQQQHNNTIPKIGLYHNTRRDIKDMCCMQLASQPLVTVLIVVVTFFSSACHNCDRVDAFMFSPIAPLSLARRIVRPQANAKREISSPKSRLDASSSPSNDGGLTTQEVARQLIKENTLPSSDDNHEDSSNPFSSYDNEISEFHALMATFLTYSRKDIRSLSSTCNRYLNYKLDLPRESGEDRGIRQTRKRSGPSP